MFENNFVFWWCYALLFVASSSKHQRNFTNNNEKHDISTAQDKIDENSIKDYVDEKDIDISTIYNFNETDCNEDSNECFVPHLICNNNNICLLFCCHLDDHLTECIPGEIKTFQAFKDEQYSLQSKNQEINLTAHGFTYDPCQKSKQFHIINYNDINTNVLIANGTVYSPYHVKFVESKSSCLMDENRNMLYTGCNITNFSINFPTEIVLRILIYKMDSPDNPLKTILNHYISICISLRIISMLFLLTIFLVYSILPQLRNKHGFILRNCISATIVAYIFESTDYLTNTIFLGNFIKFTIVSVYYFGFLAAYFWLTVMSFDMWWTFRDISSLLQTNMRNRQQEGERKKKERKKLIMYSVYAWGSSFILTTVCVIMNSFPFLRLPSLRAEFSIIIIWFTDFIEIGLYYCIPSIICSVSNICLFISTALKIRRYEKNTTHHLRNVDSRVYDENKKWFNLCQKWFIMMFIVIGISAFIGTVSLIFPYTSNYWYIFYIAYLTDVAQDIGIFITFVCKKRIKKLLLTRFGYQNYNVPPIARQTEVVTDSNTRNIRSRMIRLRERINLWQTSRRRNNMHDETAM